MKNIIDKTYNGDKYPIIEREYNANFFPENYNPDNMDNQAEAIMKKIMKNKRKNLGKELIE